MNESDVILTGVPRSGTTLVCHLLNKLPDTVALHEPIPWAQLVRMRDHQVACDEIARFFEQSRASLLTEGVAFSKHVRGRVPDNPKSDYPLLFRLLPSRSLGRRFLGRSVLRKSRESWGRIEVTKELPSDFLLCIKHNAFFTALLETLSRRYRCYATVRNPLAVLASWNSIDFNARNGHVPAAEQLDLFLALELARIDDRMERQLYVLSWFFEKFHAILPPENVMRYEDIVASGGKALKGITQRAAQLDETLENRNKSRLYNRQLMRTLGEKLLRTEGAFWEFYSRTEVERLLSYISHP